MAIRGGVACLGLWGAIGTCLAQSDLPSTGQALAGLEAFDAVMLGTMKQHDYPGGTLAVSSSGDVTSKTGIIGNASGAAATAMCIATCEPTS